MPDGTNPNFAPIGRFTGAAAGLRFEVLRSMVRSALVILLATALAATPAAARSRPKPKADATTDDSGDAKSKGKAGPKTEKDAKGKPTPVGTFGDWGAFTAQGKGKTCYALAQPRDRTPGALKREAAYVFISNRPGENVRNEVSIIMGFAMKDNSDAKAEINGTTFDLICKGANAWVKNAAREGEFVDAMRRGSKLVIKASSIKGNVTTDSYSLAGLSDALARVQKDCP